MKSDNKLLSELLRRGIAPLMPANEEDEAKIHTFKKYWQAFNYKEIEQILKNAYEVKVNQTSAQYVKTA